MEEGNIDRDRIINGDLVADEYFCPICQYLLWKPRSCSSCQHIFCENCIKTWIESANSNKKCPFRCELPFEYRQCPPYVQSILSRLNIHCRNSSLGCTEILSYDSLEYHENVQCKYLSKKCSECEKLILVSEFNQHENIPGLCIPIPIKCTICQNYFEKSIFREHFYECCQNKINQLNTIANTNRLLQTLNGQPVAYNNGLTFMETVTNTIQLVEQQRHLSRLPTSLKGADAVRRAREQNCGHFYHILIMIKFVLFNWIKIPYFILILSTGGLFAIGILTLGIFILFSHWIYTHIYLGPFLLILLSYLLSYGTCIFFQFISDTTIIICFGIIIFLWGCSSRAPLEIFETNILFNKMTTCTVVCLIGVLIMKIVLLLIRFYYWLLPTYISAGLFTFINFYLAFKAYRMHSNTLAATTTTNQVMMLV